MIHYARDGRMVFVLSVPTDPTLTVIVSANKSVDSVKTTVPKQVPVPSVTLVSNSTTVPVIPSNRKAYSETVKPPTATGTA